MKRLILLVYFTSLSWGLEKSSTLHLYEKIMTALVHSKPHIYVFSPELKRILQTRFHIVENAARADLVILDTKEQAQSLEHVLKQGKTRGCKPILFVTSYHLLKSLKTAVGALYWKKGRIQLLFIRKRLKRCRIVLPPELRRYEIKEID